LHIEANSTRLWFDVDGPVLMPDGSEMRAPNRGPGHGRSEWGDPATWSFELAADGIRDFCDAVGIARPVVYGHSLGGMVVVVYTVRHPGHPGALVLQSTMARFDLGRVVEGIRRAGGDEAASASPYRQELEVAPCARRAAATSSPAV
jgi:pimeloyl-ACP methyl ester carboxylesterase